MTKLTEEALAAKAMGDILTSTMQRAYDEGRTFLYCWESDGLQWLLRYLDRFTSGSVGNDWMLHFLELNKDAILSADGRMDFNLRAHDERKRFHGDGAI